MNVYLFKLNTVKENFEVIISAPDVDRAINFIKKDFKKSYIPLNKQARIYLKEEIRLMKQMFINTKQKVKLEKDKSLLEALDFEIFGVEDFFKISYNQYIKDKRDFNKKYIDAYMKYYYRKDYSFKYNLDHEHYELYNLTKATRNKRTRILNHTTIKKEEIK